MIDFIRRLVPLLQATWIQADVILDGRQTWTYYKHADPNNSDYSKWAEDYRERTNSTHAHTVSELYFVTGMVVWMLTPFLLALFALVSSKRPLYLFNVIFSSTCKIELNGNNCLKVIQILITLPIQIISAGIIIFVAIPFASLKRSFKILFKHEFQDNESFVTLDGFLMNSKLLPLWKGFEFIGEAIPQLIIAIVFIANNYKFMQEHETLFGFKEFEVTLISMIFSIGSIAMGLYSSNGIIFFEL